MNIDVNKPVENPRLSELLKEYKNCDDADRRELQEKIAEELAMNAHLLAIVDLDEDKIEKKDGNTAVFKEGSHISFAMLKGANNNDYLPVYTDWNAIGKNEGYRNTRVNTFILSFDDMAAITKGKAGIVINPFSDDFVITPENVIHIKKHKDSITKGYSENVIEKETTVSIGDPADYPTEMVEAIRAYAKTNKNIDAIWLKLMIKEDERSYLLIVDSKGDMNTVFSSIAHAASPHNRSGLPIDMVPFADEFGMKCAKGEPIYKRKKGLFW
ncbi:MAG: enhanced serine sensitivity protein SseB [Erysipelotrichaceae bacterium]|nr:enhanced serine sensitivity protein SseB [Erysipelotrichaceae bacterium]